MAKAAAKNKKTKSSKKAAKAKLPLSRRIRRWVLRAVLGIAGAFLFFVLLFSVVNPPVTHTIWAEQRRLGDVDGIGARQGEAAGEAAMGLEQGIQRTGRRPGAGFVALGFG